MERKNKLASVKDHLRQMAEEMSDLADRIASHGDVEDLTPQEKKLVQMAYIPHIEVCMDELKMFYLMNNREDIKDSIGYIHDLMIESI